MDPISIQSPQSVVLRPTGTGDELARVLQRGQVVAGEVLQSSDDGHVVLALARQRVAAQSAVRLQPGQRFAFEVVETADGIVLRVVEADPAADDTPLLRALRAVMGTSRPVGEMLAELRSVLMADGPAPGSTLARLVDALGRHVWVPGAGPEELARLLSSSGTSYEAHLLDQALRSSSPRQLERVARALWTGLYAELAGADDAHGRGAQGFFDDLGEALWRVVARGLGLESSAARARALETLDWSAMAREIKSWLGRASRELGHQPALQSALTRLAAVDFGSWTHGERALLLRALLGAPLEPQPGRDSARGRARTTALLGDLKAELLAARDGAAAGPARQAIERALATLESEQLLNLARAESGEPRQWSLPLADGARFATLELSYRHHVERDAAGEEGELVHRLAFSVDYTYVGPVRADLLARPQRLSLRLSVAEPSVLARLRGDLAALEARLATGGRSVQITLVPAEPAEASVRSHPGEIRYLREHHVMDLQG